MAVTQAPDAFRCAVAEAAVSDWTGQQAQTETRAFFRRHLQPWRFCDYPAGGQTS